MAPLDAEAEALVAPTTRLFDGWRGHAIRATLLVVASVALAGWIFLAATHVDDRYGVGHVQGAWMGLAQYANEGLLYPPLFDGERYGGTRWMPVPILVNAAAARVTGEYLISGKLVGIAAMAVLLGIVFALLRRFSCPTPLAATLTAGIVATDAGRLAGTSLGGDVIPVILQLLAVISAASLRRRSLLLAAVLAGLALTSKTTGVWASLAILTYLAVHRRWRDAATFGVLFAGTATVVLALVEVASEGRLSDNLALLTLAGVGGGAGPIRAPNQILFFLANAGLAVWALLPFAFLGAVTVPGVRRLSPWHLALGWALLLLLVVYADVGSGFNQLLDITVLGVLGVGHLAGRLNRVGAMTAPLAAALTLVVLWAVGTSTVLVLLADVRATVRDDPLGYPLQPLAERVLPGESILSEDPYVPLSFGEKPVVLDPFMLRRLDRVDPGAVDELIVRIEQREFDHVVMVESLDPENDYWWENFHFGLRVIEALRRAYVLDERVDDYYVYRPAS